MSKNLRIAVIGAGHLGRIHAKLLQSVEGAELVAVCDPTTESCQKLAATHGVTGHSNYEDCVDKIDAAILAAPTPLHADIATTLMNAGKHVFVEKPLATREFDARRLALLASTRNVVLQVGHVERFNPAFAALDRFGTDVKYVEATRASRFPGRCLDVGVVMDLMIHDLDLVLSLTDAAIRSVSASGLSVVSSHEDIAEARIEFEDGLVANLKASRISPLPCRDMTLFSPAGMAQIDFGKPSLATVAASDSLATRTFDLEQETDHALSFADELFSKHLVCQTQVIEPRNAILDELHDFVISIQSGCAPMVDGNAGARAVSVASLVLNAIAERSWYGDASPQRTGCHASPRRRIDESTRKAA